MKILITEDDFTSRIVPTTVLKKQGHEVMATVNGAEAWQAMQPPELYDLEFPLTTAKVCQLWISTTIERGMGNGELLSGSQLTTIEARAWSYDVHAER
jgi:CheY-like chemotaxis protein